jgi:hypothetical protein
MNKEVTSDTPRTDGVFNIVAGISRCQSDLQQERRLRDLSMELERELAASKAEVERLKEAMISCLHITNCYDGNYARACDNVDLIVRNALK